MGSLPGVVAQRRPFERGTHVRARGSSPRRMLSLIERAPNSPSDAPSDAVQTYRRICIVGCALCPTPSCPAHLDRSPLAVPTQLWGHHRGGMLHPYLHPDSPMPEPPLRLDHGLANRRKLAAKAVLKQTLPPVFDEFRAAPYLVTEATLRSNLTIEVREIRIRPRLRHCKCWPWDALRIGLRQPRSPVWFTGVVECLGVPGSRLQVLPPKRSS